MEEHMDQHDATFLEQVASDLTYLDTDWHERVDDHTIRRSVPILRRLLYERDLVRAWKLCGLQGEPKLDVTDILPVIKGLEAKTIGLATAGGAKVGGVTTYGTMIYNGPMSEEDLDERSKKSTRTTLNLSAAMQRACLVTGGLHINRDEIITYYANKWGGAHFDKSRDGNDAAKHVAMDKAMATYHIGGKRAVIHEVLACGQALAKSPDVHLLRAELDKRGFR